MIKILNLPTYLHLTSYKIRSDIKVKQAYLMQHVHFYNNDP